MTPTIEDVLKKFSQFSRNDFGLAGDGKPEYISIKDARTAMYQYASLNRQGWTRVSVADEMPPEAMDDDRIFVFLSDGNIDYNYGWFIRNGNGAITHWLKPPPNWMPLPNKPI